MSTVATDSFTVYELVSPGEAPCAATRARRALADDEVFVRVAGCGVCHTDLGYAYDGVRTRHALPLVLGHEISGYVEDAGSKYRNLVGKAVVVPAVLPCGECAACKSGRPGICPKQVMPGNDADGGFASHAILPGRGICEVPGASGDPDATLGSAPGLTLRHLSVVADAVSTAYQSVVRSGLKPGELAVVVGLGGVGGYAAQWAADLGATVVGLDVDERRLATAKGVSLGLDPKAMAPKDLKKALFAFAKEKGLPSFGWTILECSGTVPGQTTAYSLLVPGATLMVVGYTMGEATLRLSNLMAFEAKAVGNWGCAPEHYPALLSKILAGKVDVVSGTEMRPLSTIAEAFEEVRAHKTDKRLVLVPGK